MVVQVCAYSCALAFLEVLNFRAYALLGKIVLPKEIIEHLFPIKQLVIYASFYRFNAQNLHIKPTRARRAVPLQPPPYPLRKITGVQPHSASLQGRKVREPRPQMRKIRVI